MKPMSEKRIFIWEKLREKGRWFYILKYTMNLTGAAIFSSFLTAAMFGYRSLFLLWFTPLYLVLGVLAGMAAWLYNEDKYQTYLLEKRIGKPLEF